MFRGRHSLFGLSANLLTKLASVLFPAARLDDRPSHAKMKLLLATS